MPRQPSFGRARPDGTNQDFDPASGQDTADVGGADPTSSAAGTLTMTGGFGNGGTLTINSATTTPSVVVVAAPAAASSFAVTAGGITLNLMFDAAAMGAPVSFRAGIVQAANQLAATMSDPITVNLSVDFSGLGGGAAAGPAGADFQSYSSVRSVLIANAAAGDHSFDALPAGASIQGQSSVSVWYAEEKALGLLSPTASGVDGETFFATDIDPNLLVGVALHELTHAMGRVPNGPQPGIFDLFRFTSIGQRLFSADSTAPPAYFSIDGGTTKLADYGQTSDVSDFLNTGVQGPNDPFNEFYSDGTSQQLSAVDRKQLDVLGFHIAAPGSLSLGVVVNGGQAFVVGAGQIATSSTVQSGGVEVVSSGGTARGTTVLAGGTEAVWAGGTASGTVLSGGSELVTGRTSGTTVGSGGNEVIRAGGVASGTTVSAGGFEVVSSGGIARATNVLAGGFEAVLSGGVASGTMLGSGSIEMVVSGQTFGTVVGGGGTQVVSGGSVANGTMVSNGGNQYVRGTEIGTTVSSGGYDLVLSGGTVSGATIAGGTLEIQSGGTAGSSTIAFAGGGVLKLDNATAFGGKISGFAASDYIDLADIAFGAPSTLNYSGNTLSGTLTVLDGVHTATLNLLGQYVAANFVLLSDGHGGTIVSEHPLAGQQLLVNPQG